LPSSQVLALFNKVVRKLSTLLRSVEESAIVTEIGPEDHVKAAANSLPIEGLEQTLSADLVAVGDDGGRNETEECDKDDGVVGGKECEDVENAKKVTGIAKEKSHQCSADGAAACVSGNAGGGYEITGDDGEWDSVLARATKAGAPDIVSIKATKRSARVGVDAGESCRKKKVKRVRK
jgi:Possible tRNA binding domain